jgi:hypothetical protein
MRRGHSGRVDRNQAEILKALKQIGCSVQTLASVGAGCPDALIGYGGRNILLEIKSPKGDSTSHQITWAARWSGQLAIVRTVDEAIGAVTRA